MSENLLPEAISELIEQLSKLPTVGRKSAQRLTFYLLRQQNEDIDKLSKAISGIKEDIRFCKQCFNLCNDELCKICLNPARNEKCICVVEDVLDLIAIEGTHEYNGLYHVLHGALSPLDNIGPDKLKLKELFERVNSSEKTEIEEIILANNTTSEGEATALYINHHLKDRPIKISRIASGLPVGGDLDYADSITLGRALKGRGEF